MHRPHAVPLDGQFSTHSFWGISQNAFKYNVCLRPGEGSVYFTGKMTSWTIERNCHFPLPGILPWGNLSALELYITISLFLKEKHLPDFLCEENILILVFQSKPFLQQWIIYRASLFLRMGYRECWLRASLIFTPNSLCCLITRSNSFTTPWTLARGQAPLSMGFPRQESWSELPFSSPLLLTVDYLKS